MPCYGAYGPFEYSKVFGDPLIDALLTVYKTGFKDGLRFAKEKEDKK